MKEPNRKKLAQRWFARADSDLLFAKKGFEETGIPYSACFLAQQIAEKYLKGFLISENIRPKRTHVLPDLLEECLKLDENFSQLKEECRFLNQFYNPARYPDDLQIDFSKDAAEKALGAAEEIIDFIKKKIKYGDLE